MRKYLWYIQFLLLFRNLTNIKYLQNRHVKEYQERHLAIGEMVCVDCLPFYTVENLGSFV